MCEEKNVMHQRHVEKNNSRMAIFTGWRGSVFYTCVIFVEAVDVGIGGYCRVLSCSS